jgi:hypothetical protein
VLSEVVVASAVVGGVVVGAAVVGAAVVEASLVGAVVEATVVGAWVFSVVDSVARVIAVSGAATTEGTAAVVELVTALAGVDAATVVTPEVTVSALTPPTDVKAGRVSAVGAFPATAGTVVVVVGSVALVRSWTTSTASMLSASTTRLLVISVP